jgi:hypothetical protein
LGGLWACNEARPKDGDVPIAQVYDKFLYYSDMEGSIPEGMSPSDSALLAGAFIQRWVRDQLLMIDAERNIPSDLNIDGLVRDYRASLIRHNYEEALIARQLDSIVREDEVRAYYENNKDEFQLESTILKCLLIKVRAGAPQNELNKLWNSRNPEDEVKLGVLVKQMSVSKALLNRQKWYRLDDIAAFLPKGTLTPETVASRREGTLSDRDYRYYYRVLQSVRGKETAPFDYVKEQATKVILHRRKQELIEKWKEDLYKKGISQNDVKLF